MEFKSRPLRYYVVLDNNEHGPFSILELQQLIKEKVALHSSFVREEDSLEKILLGEVLKNAKKYESNLRKKRAIPIILLCTFVLFIILISMIFYGFYDKITSLENSLSESVILINSNTLQSVEKDINNLKEKIDKIESAKNVYQKELNDFKILVSVDFEKIKKSLEDSSLILNNLLATIQKEVNDNKIDYVNQINNANAGFNKNINLLGIKLENFEKKLASYQKIFDALNDNIKQNNENIVKSNKKIEFINSTLNDHKTSLIYLGEEINKLKKPGR